MLLQKTPESSQVSQEISVSQRPVSQFGRQFSARSSKNYTVEGFKDVISKLKSLTSGKKSSKSHQTGFDDISQNAISKIVVVNESADHSYSNDKNKSKYERENWNNRLDFIFSTLGYIVGLGAVWRL